MTKYNENCDQTTYDFNMRLFDRHSSISIGQSQLINLIYLKQMNVELNNSRLPFWLPRVNRCPVMPLRGQNFDSNLLFFFRHVHTRIVAPRKSILGEQQLRIVPTLFSGPGHFTTNFKNVPRNTGSPSLVYG